ncbi:MAG: DUF975 family protein [Oscillospiraceae bacterium]|nr:DUF975 family protein [Oscillospiraceae bacterium]
MWRRKELKSRGKAAFKANYWRCVLVALILALITGAVGAAGGGVHYKNIKDLVGQQSYSSMSSVQDVQELIGNLGDTGDIVSDEDLNNYLNGLGIDMSGLSGGNSANHKLDMSVIKAYLPYIFAAGFVGFILALAISIFLTNPIEVGCKRFFAENSREPAKLGEVAYGFENGYLRTVKTMLIKDIFIILWSLLFVIPGIIKSYSYRMVPYILAEEPELEGRTAINRSRQMMKGNKWRAFVLDLSFILWYLLTAITLGIVGVFYVQPYVSAANAELYHAIKD